MALEGPRGARPDEVPAVVALADEVFAPEARDMGPSFPTLFPPGNAEWLRTFWDGGACVSHVGIWRGAVWTHGRRLEVAHVGAVCTRPAYRRQGLAGALLADVLPRLHALGVALLLISGGRSLYLRLGARPFGRLLRYRVPRAVLPGMGGVRTAPPADASPLVALYAAEPLRYERTRREWELLLPAKGFVPAARGRGALCVSMDGVRPGPDAYLLLGRPRHPSGNGDGGSVLPVDEFAGDRRAVLAALGAALAAADAQAAELLVQPGDAEMRRLLGALGVAGEPCGHQGTARVLNAEACAGALGLPVPEPAGALGTEAEAEAAAAWTEAWFGAVGAELPRNDGLNYI